MVAMTEFDSYKTLEFVCPEQGCQLLFAKYVRHKGFVVMPLHKCLIIPLSFSAVVDAENEIQQYSIVELYYQISVVRNQKGIYNTEKSSYNSESVLTSSSQPAQFIQQNFVEARNCLWYQLCEGR